MKQIQLTQGKFAIVDDEDFEILSQNKWYLGADGYARRNIKEGSKKTAIPMHRALLNPPSDRLIDHKNGNRCDNRRDNLRICTRSENAMNRGKTKQNSSGYKGIYPEKHSKTNPWRAKIQIRGKSVQLGSFSSAKAAAEAYCEAALKYHGEYARFTRI